jgi:hypothetical protein
MQTARDADPRNLLIKPYGESATSDDANRVFFRVIRLNREATWA